MMEIIMQGAIMMEETVVDLMSTKNFALHVHVLVWTYEISFFPLRFLCQRRRCGLERLKVRQRIHLKNQYQETSSFDTVFDL